MLTAGDAEGGRRRGAGWQAVGQAPLPGRPPVSPASLPRAVSVPRCSPARFAIRIRGDVMAMDWHDTLMGSVLVISSGLTVAYIRAGSRILLILTLIGAAATFVIGVLLFFHLA